MQIRGPLFRSAEALSRSESVAARVFTGLPATAHHVSGTALANRPDRRGDKAAAR